MDIDWHSFDLAFQEKIWISDEICGFSGYVMVESNGGRERENFCLVDELYLDHERRRH